MFLKNKLAQAKSERSIDNVSLLLQALGNASSGINETMISNIACMWKVLSNRQVTDLEFQSHYEHSLK